MHHVYTVQFAKTVKMQGQYGEVQCSTSYVLADSFEQALEKFRAKHPDIPVRGVALLDYAYGIPILE